MSSMCQTICPRRDYGVNVVQAIRWELRANAALTKARLLMSARLAAPVLVAAMVVGGGSVARAEPVSMQHSATVAATEVASAASGLVSFQWRTTVDATDVGGKAFTPVRLIYTFDPDLAPASGFTGSGPHFVGYGPLSQWSLEVGNQCATISGPGTAITVFDDAGTNSITDAYDVRASATAGATLSGPLFKLDFSLFAFGVFDNDSTMFSSTALPLTPDFAALAEFQGVLLRLVDPLTLTTFDLHSDSGFEVSFHRPVESLQALLAEVDGLNLSGSLKKNLTTRLQSALDVLTDSSTGNDQLAAEHLQKFIQLVDAQAGKGIPATTADQLIADALDVINQLPPKGCS
jgi:hypothetical protein